MIRSACLAALLGVVGTSAVAQPLFNVNPDWVSTDTEYSTGAALVDLNRDGWLDLVVSNGNDMAQQHLAVYYNLGNGTLQSSPGWQSTDFVYNGHLDVADVNADGWPDVAVATLGSGSSGRGPIARLYMNNAGTLGATPAWSANIVGNAFGCAFGDMNNDGRPDLAVGTGWAYSPQIYYHNYVYLNFNGALLPTPSWTSDDTYHYQGVCWVDADGDGWLDLAGAASRTRNRIYRNLGGTLETTASWSAIDVDNPDAIMVTAGDINGDQAPEIIIADNNQLSGGSGRFRVYLGVPGAMPETLASWVYLEGYCSAVELADVDSDGLLDLATGAWWDNVRVFLNEGTGYGTPADWSSSSNAWVVEKVIFGDINKDGLRPVEEVFTDVPAGRRLFKLAHQPIQEVTAVVRDGVPLTAAQYYVNTVHGWMTINGDVASELVVQYTASSRLDMAVTDWDPDLGNFVQYNQHLVLGDANCDGRVDFLDINPFVALLTGTYDEKFPDCHGHTFCDLNGSGDIDFGDINPFVALIVGG